MEGGAMTDRELLQQLLAVLLDYPAEEKSVDAIRIRLAQPEHEPVAWLCWEDKENNLLADTVLSDKACTECFPVYTAPPKKEWVGLTNDEQLEAIWESGKDGLTGDRYDVARAIEAKLKEKNSG